jgi:TPP-dependent pyruvate/acetoin dehydrogenase alpha subunit
MRLGPNDWIAPMIRNIGGLLVRGFRPREILTQHMASATSPTLGKDGTSHMGDLYVRHVIAPTSVLGDLISVMTGVAMAGRYLGQKIVALTWTGDGGTSTGAFHEGMNFAAVQKAPLVVVDRKQSVGLLDAGEQAGAILRNLADRARAYGIPSMVVDGNDVVAVLQTVRQAVAMAPRWRRTGPCRSQDHADGGTCAARCRGLRAARDLFEYWKARDPIDRFEKHLTSNRLWDEKPRPTIDAALSVKWPRTWRLRKISRYPRPNPPKKASTATAATRSKRNGSGRKRK